MSIYIWLLLAIKQNSSNELSPLVSGREKCKQTKTATLWLIIHEQTLFGCWLSGMILSLNVKLGRFRSQLQASYLFSYIGELWYNEWVCLWMTIHIYIYKRWTKAMRNFEYMIFFSFIVLINFNSKSSSEEKSLFVELKVFFYKVFKD